MPEMTPSSCISRGASDLRSSPGALHYWGPLQALPLHLLPQEWDALLVDGRGGGVDFSYAPRILREHLRLLRAVPDEVGVDADGHLPELPG